VFERVEDTKSQAGFRRVQVGAGASAMFRRRVGAARPGGLVFTNRHGRMWLPATFRASAWLPAVEVANLSRRPTPHWLRHTHVVELIDRGVPLPEISARLGHESIGVTVDVYGRLGRGVAVSVLDALDGPSLPAVEGTVIASHVITEET
jgi:integrase